MNAHRPDAQTGYHFPLQSASAMFHVKPPPSHPT
jgi:hypothetical protein